MAYIDTTYVDNAITSAVRLKLTPDATVFDQIETMARARINSALNHRGISVPLTGTIPEDVKLATYGVWLRLAYGRAQLDPPERYNWLLEIADAIIAGTFPIPSIAASPAAGVGGVLFTDSDSTTTDTVPQVFGARFLRYL